MSQAELPQNKRPAYAPFPSATFLGRDGCDDVWCAADGGLLFWSPHYRRSLGALMPPRTDRERRWVRVAKERGLRKGNQ